MAIRITVASSQQEIDDNRIDEESGARLIEIATKIAAESKAAIAEMLQEHTLTLERMQEEQRLEIAAAKQGVNSSVETGENSINSNSNA